MKKIFLAVLFINLGIFSGFAQVGSGPVQWGVKGGVNFANITGDDLDDVQSKTDFHAGLLTEIPVNERFSVQPELLYSRQGFKVADNEYGKAKYNIQYIQVPVLLKAYLLRGLNIHAGPQIGFNVHEDFEYDTRWGSGSEDTSDSKIKDIDFDIAAGLGYKFDGGLFVYFRYNYGITKLLDDFDAHNAVFQIGAGIML